MGRAVMEISGENAPTLYSECLWRMKIMGVSENSRNGPVLVIPEPVILSMDYPKERYLFDPIRQANPFFHIMEFVWMMAGRKDLDWIEDFNAGYAAYADDGVINGAYGHRWRRHWGLDQIRLVINILSRDPESRRAVINMWDPATDLGMPHRDVPCNTSIYFSVRKGAVHMTVSNRSNDLIWGALGANVVHMTMLQELVALATGHAVGTYRVMTNNLHVYPEMPRGKEILSALSSPDLYSEEGLGTTSLLRVGETYEDFVGDAEKLCNGDLDGYKTRWFVNVALPVHDAYLARKSGADPSTVNALLNRITAPDVKRACELWVQWKDEQKRKSNEKSDS
jgi:hypothetical protein